MAKKAKNGQPAQQLNRPANWKELEVHPIAALFPPMPEDQYEALEQDLDEHGQHDPILLFENKILDGRARHLALVKLNKEPTFKVWEGNGDDFALWIRAKSANLIRTHVPAEQRAACFMLAAYKFDAIKEALALIEGAAKLREEMGVKIKGHAKKHGSSASMIGKMCGVSSTTIERIRRIDNYSRGKLELVASGKMTAGQVLKEIADAKARLEKLAEEAGKVAKKKKYDLIYASTDHIYSGTDLSDFAANHCGMFCWCKPAELVTTAAKLARWGFDYRGIAVWDTGGGGRFLVVGKKGHQSVAAPQKLLWKDKAEKGRHYPLAFVELACGLAPWAKVRLDLTRDPKIEAEGWDCPDTPKAHEPEEEDE